MTQRGQPLLGKRRQWKSGILMYCIDLFAALNHVQVGGKAFNLAKASAPGVSVPPGFVLAQSALTCFLEENALTRQVGDFIEHYNWSERSERQLRYEALCSTALAAPIPEPVKSQVELLAKELLEAAPVGLAVRSSGIHEDMQSASFAGVFKSFLCISTVEDLWNKILLCWCSSWSPQAIGYAKRKGIDLEPDQMAVIVQKAIPAESAGVLFTADPLTGNPWRFVVNATVGLAQSLVDGSVSADRFVLEWDTGRILEKHIAEKTTAMVADRSGVKEIALPDAQKKTASLSDEMVGKVGRMALTLDAAFDMRVDIEWAVAGQEIYLVQVRPITALPTYFPHELSGAEAELTWTLSDPVWYISAQEKERIVAPLFRDRWALELWHRNLAPGDIFPRREGHERDFNGYRYSTEWVWKTDRDDTDWTEQWLNENEGHLRNAWITQKESILRACRQIAQAQKNVQRATELVSLLLDFHKRENEMQAAVWAAPQWLGFTCEYLLREFAKGVAPDFSIEKLLQGLSSYSYERTKAAQDLGRSIHEDIVKDIFARKTPETILPCLLAQCPESRFLKDYEEFCWQFGICPPTWPKVWARWSQDPTQILLVIRNAMLGQGCDASEVLEECICNRKASEEQLGLCVTQRDSSLINRLNGILAWAQFWVPVLDDRGWHYVATTRLADLMRQTGAVLVAEGLIDKPTDVLLLTVDDLAEIAKSDDVRPSRELYLVRKQEYERNRRLTPPPFLGASPGVPHSEKKSSIENSLELSRVSVFKGQGFSPGRVTGISRKVGALNDPAFLESLTSEHILVCPKAKDWRPDWLSLFMVVKGLVTVRGAQLQHATQIARECGIPFVNLPEDELDNIPDSTKLSVDGGSGTVMVLE